MNPTAWCQHCEKLRPIADVLTTRRYTYYKSRNKARRTVERIEVPLTARCIEGRLGCGHRCHVVVTLDVIEAVRMRAGALVA